MIFDSLDNLLRYRDLHPAIETLAHIVSSASFRSAPDGSFETGRTDLACSIMTFDTGSEDKPFEYHKRSCDAFVMLSGSEVCKSARSCADMNDPAFCSADIAFADGQADDELVLGKGCFVIYFPGELHKSGIRANDDTVRKAVFKLLC